MRIFLALALTASAVASLPGQTPSNPAQDDVIRTNTNVVYEGSWQPLGEKIIRKDSLGIEIGVEIRMTSAPSVYTLRITIKDGKVTVQQTREFELQQ